MTYEKKSELFDQINQHLISDSQPSDYLKSIYNSTEFQEYPFDLLLKLQSTNQSPLHHPEGNVWNHTLLVVDEAAKRREQSKDVAIFMWAALLHDIGKPSTTKNKKGKITSYDHDAVGAKLSKDFLAEFTEDLHFINGVSILIKFHMQILYVTNNLHFADIKGMQQDSDIHEIALLGLCDRLGRVGINKNKEESNIELFIKQCEIKIKR